MTQITMEEGGILRIPQSDAARMSLRPGDTLYCFTDKLSMRIMPKSHLISAGSPPQARVLRCLLRLFYAL